VAEKKVVGYLNAMPLEDSAFQLVLDGVIGDSMITPDRLRTFEMPGPYKLLVSALAILPEYRRTSVAFRTLYEAAIDKLLNFAESGIVVTEVAAVAWTTDGASLARGFGMKCVKKHDRHGEVFHCRLVPSTVERPSFRIQALLEKYRTMGFS
jgi:hypothetical protein